MTMVPLDATDRDAHSFARHVEVNLFGLTNVLAAVIPEMVEAEHRHLVGIASALDGNGDARSEFLVLNGAGPAAPSNVSSCGSRSAAPESVGSSSVD